MRPHVELIQQADLCWHTAELPRGNGEARQRNMSYDEEDGSASTLVHFDIPVMIAVAFACLPLFATGQRIARWEGALFLGYYAVYVAYLILAATQHDALPLLSATMLGFALPLTAVTLLVLWAQSRVRSG